VEEEDSSTYILLCQKGATIWSVVTARLKITNDSIFFFWRGGGGALLYSSLSGMPNTTKGLIQGWNGNFARALYKMDFMK